MRHEHPGEDRIPPVVAEHPQMEITAQASDIMFRGLENIRKLQERAARESLARHSSVIGKMKAPAEPAGLILAHAQLQSDDVNAAARCWQEIGAVALEMQAQLAACCTGMVETDKVLQAAASLGHPSS
jgi:hypothetical protein